MEIRILGSLEVVVDDRPLTLGGRRERSLLAMLAMVPGQPISTDRLIDGLWEEDLPGHPVNALQAIVSRLRRVVGAEAVVTRSPGYLLDVSPEAVDATRFRAMLSRAGEVTDHRARAQALRDALALWRGPALADFPFAEFAQREAGALEELRMSAIEKRIEADLDAGGGAELVPELEELVAAHPLRESLRASQMLALYRAGRQAEALRVYTAARELLGTELGIEPSPQLRDLEQAILMHDPSLLGATSGGDGSMRARPLLPARLASFVGREREMDEIAAAFAESRLVTLTGVGGAGKTSLAVEVGRAVDPGYADGVWLVELASVTEPSHVAGTLVSSLELEHVEGTTAGRLQTALGTVVEYLRHRSGLLILDNCEHVISAAAAAVEAILLACPQVDVLATSRERLGTPGETVWRVPSLGLADDGGPSDAVSLFLDRARAVNQQFDPGQDDLHAIAAICSKVAGIPLAIELAAARTRSLPVAEIDRRLDEGISVLRGGGRGTPDRQQTLAATIDWSYRLLEPSEQDLFAALSVFRGSFSLDAAEAVAPPEIAAEDSILESLERLIDSSVVTMETADAQNRYRILEPLRIYAAERLASQNRRDPAMARLLEHFTDDLAGLESQLRGPDQLAALAGVEADRDTIRSVLDWGVDGAPAAALRLAGMLGWFWYLRGNSAEARGRIERLLERAGPGADARSRGDGWFFYGLHDPLPESAQTAYRRALDAYTEAGYSFGVANATAMMATCGTDQDQMIFSLNDSAQLYADEDSEWGLALVRFLQAGAGMIGNDMKVALGFAEEAAERFTTTGDRWGQGYSLYLVGIALRAMGEYDRAEAAFWSALDQARPMRLLREMAPVISELASIATMRGDYDAAAHLLAEAKIHADEAPLAGSRGMVRNARGRLARRTGDLDLAIRLHREALDIYVKEQNPAGLAHSHSCLGFALEMAGEVDAAVTEHAAALERAREASDQFAIALALEGLGCALVAGGDVEAGLKIVGAGLGTREMAGTPLASGERFDVDRAIATGCDQLGDAAVEALLADGRGIKLETAADLVAAFVG